MVDENHIREIMRILGRLESSTEEQSKQNESMAAEISSIRRDLNAQELRTSTSAAISKTQATIFIAGVSIVWNALIAVAIKYFGSAKTF